MKVFAESLIKDFAVSREVEALKKYAPPSAEFVDTEEEADLVVIYAHGLRRMIWWQTGRLRQRGKKFAILQLNLRSTPNPKTEDWLNIWEPAEVVWSYYDLPKLCQEDGNPAKFNFYHAPLGVDAEVFKETPQDRKYIAFIHSKGWSREGLAEVVTAARAVNRRVLNLGVPKELGEGVDYTGVIDDETLARDYSQAEYVTGLRRIEGFELPVIEGLMCGARPICFDQPHYRMWFDGFAEFIPENGREGITESLTELFKKKPRPVTEAEKAAVKEKFNWQPLVEGFWQRAGL